MTLVLMLLLKSILVFTLSGLVLLCLRRASASARHLVCLLTLSALLALPLFSLTLPGWHMAGLQEGPTPVRPSPALPVREGKELNPADSHGPGPALVAPSFSVSSSSSSLAGRTPAEQGGGFLQNGFFFYLLGLLLAATRPLLGLWGITRLRRACASVIDTPTLRVSADCAATLGLTRLPLLCRANVPVPLTWGWRHPVVLLPTESEDWPADRTEAVLLHEMAHIKRCDWLSHRLADLVCAVYWFHPLVWLTARRLRAESEAACDDLVLSSGIAAPEYARHLLEIVGALARPLPGQSAIAMAQTSQIAGRLKMILDKTQSRRTLTRRVLLTSLALGMIVVVPLAMLRPTAKAQAAKAQEAQTLDIETVPVGQSAAVPIELVGMTDSKEVGGKWWSASGSPVSKPPFDNLATHPLTVVGATKERTLLFAFRLPPNAQNVTTVLEAPNSILSSSLGQWPGKQQGQEKITEAKITEAMLNRATVGVRTLEAIYSASAAKASVRAGIASGPWKVAASCAINADGQTGNIFIHQVGKGYVFSPAIMMENQTTLSVATDATDDIRVVAVNTQGQNFLPAEIGSNSMDTLNQITVRFNLRPSQIKEIHVETRPFVWTEFKNIALHPAQ